MAAAHKKVAKKFVKKTPRNAQLAYRRILLKLSGESLQGPQGFGIHGETIQAIAQELKGVPKFRRHELYTSYVEGWALYCEKLGKEIGKYQDPYSDFGRLSMEVFRASRLVADVGIHYKHWTREQAIDYFRQYTALPEREIGTEIDRYITWPGQALSYYLGERAILEGRARAEKALGERFNIRAFHDAVLELGSVPLPVLQARIERFIAEGGRGPYPEME